MDQKEKIIQYWFTFIIAVLGIFKVFVIMPFVLQFKIENRFLIGAIDLIFKPADYIGGLVTMLGIFSGTLIFLFAFISMIAKFLLFVLEAYLLAAVLRRLLASEQIGVIFQNTRDFLYEKLDIKSKIEKYPILRKSKYFIYFTLVIVLIIIIFSAPGDYNAKQNENTVKKESIIEQAQKISSDIDSDGDGLKDKVELILGINPYSSDTDNDGQTDFDELKNGFSPFIVSPDGKLSEEDNDLVKKNVFDKAQELDFNGLESLRLKFINQISDKLCASNPNAEETIDVNSKKAAENSVKAGDKCMCSKIKDDYYRNACLNKLANTKADKSLCGYIFEDAGAQGKREDCLYTSMLITLDAKYCATIRTAKNQADCYMTFGLKTKNYSACDSVADVQLKDNCYYELAVFGKRPDLCEKISEAGASGQDREACKSMASTKLIPKVNF